MQQNLAIPGRPRSNERLPQRKTRRTHNDAIASHEKEKWQSRPPQYNGDRVLKHTQRKQARLIPELLFVVAHSPHKTYWHLTYIHHIAKEVTHSTAACYSAEYCHKLLYCCSRLEKLEVKSILQFAYSKAFCAIDG